ncbi:MAG: DNA polymerase III subunit alpha [Bacteroidota bacterium]
MSKNLAMREGLKDWIYDHRLKVDWIEDDVLEINSVGKFYVFDNGDEAVFDKNMDLILQDTDEEELTEDGIAFIVYLFGRCFYYTPCKASPAEMNLFKYIGEPNYEVYKAYTNLGVHGKYELLNGSMDYAMWCKKAKFYGMDALGICEKHTLAGTLPFQVAAVEAGIKPIFGMSMDVLHEGKKNEVKVYATTQQGWAGLLRISKLLNVDRWKDPYITLPELSNYGEGNVFVFGKCWIPERNTADLMSIHFDEAFYQLDVSEFLHNQIDADHLGYAKEYLDTYPDWKLAPVLLSDTYYLDKDDFEVKKLLNKIDTGASHYLSKDQYFKHFEDHYNQLQALFRANDLNRLERLVERAAGNTVWISERAKVKIATSSLHLPVYEMTTREKAEFAGQNDLFEALLDDSFDQKVPKGKENLYNERLEREIRVIRDIASEATGNDRGFVDYFLILWDLINWCKQRDIYVGPGRGSAAGSLISYLLGITSVDPIKYGLIFERFLNEKRVSSGLPDIDVDLESERRQEVKEYMRDRYGKDHVFAIGMFTTLRIKATMKDIARVKGVDTKLMNSLSKGISDKEAIKMNMPEFFMECQHNKKLKAFVNDYPGVIEPMRLLIGQPKSQSIHPAAMVITPKKDKSKPMEAYDWLPLRVHDDTLISEWEGGMVELAGFLKEDILASDALDKQHYMVKMIQEQTGKKVDLDYLPLDDPKVYELFQYGVTQDIFQFNGEGMTKYIMEMKPTCIDDLTAANALYRPATMDIDAHNDYVKLKAGEMEPVYDWRLEEVTKSTYGIMIYQEQVMEATRVIAGFSHVEADGVRKAMGKKIKELMDSYKRKFIEGAVKNGCDEFVALQIWNKIEKGAGYGFNKSHAVCYTIMAYRSAWLKANYPIYFYTSALQFAKDEKLRALIAEINKLEEVNIVPPNINYSHVRFKTDFQRGKIYWSLSRIRFVGEKGVKEIVKDREENGLYDSFLGFVDRMKTKTINKKQIMHMILSGCFDEIEGIDQLSDRYGILKTYHNYLHHAINGHEYPKDQITKNFFWSSKQIEMSGLGTINYKNVYYSSQSSKKHKNLSLLDPATIDDENKRNKLYVACGSINKVKEYPTKHGPMGKLTIQSNEDLILMTIWPDVWGGYRDEVINSQGRIVVVNAKIVYDDYMDNNALMSYAKTELEII